MAKRRIGNYPTNLNTAAEWIKVDTRRQWRLRYWHAAQRAKIIGDTMTPGRVARFKAWERDEYIPLEKKALHRVNTHRRNVPRAHAMHEAQDLDDPVKRAAFHAMRNAARTDTRFDSFLKVEDAEDVAQTGASIGK